MPSTVSVLGCFNNYFVSRVLKDADGEDLPPREVRDENSLRSKLNHTKDGLRSIRFVTRKLLEGKRGGSEYVLAITEDELR
jgi:hypothetical protein